MLTNLIATVTVSLMTNVSEVFPKHLVPDPSPVAPDGTVYTVFYGHYEDVPDPQEKWVLTNVVQDTAFSFTWDGTPHIFHAIRVKQTQPK